MCNLSKNNKPPFNVNVLVVDSDATALKATTEILTSLNYKVVGTIHSSLALDELQNHQGYFHLAVMEVHMPNVDGFKLKQIIDEEFSIPVIMISVDNSEEIQKKALMFGVMRYILKPAKAEDFIGIWQFAVPVMKGKMPTNTKVVGDIIEDQSNGGSKHHNELSCSAFTQEHNRVEEKSDDMEQSSMNTRKDNGSSSHKKTKVVWTKDLQSRFLEAIDILGPKDAIPTKILQVMNVEGLTRSNVASHFQKYRLFLKRVERILATIIKKGNQDNDVFLSEMALTHSSLVFKLIKDDLEKNMKQSKWRSLEYLESNDIYISHLRSKISNLLSKFDNCSNHKLNPYVKWDLPLGTVNSKATQSYHLHTNANDELSTLNLVQYNESSQNLSISPSKIANYDFNKHRLGQKSSSNVAMYNIVGLLKSSSSSLVGGVRFATGEVYSKKQSLPISMGDTNTIGNIVMGGTSLQSQQQHQIYNQGYHQGVTTMEDNFASQGTSNGIHFKGIDDALSMGGILNEVLVQDKNIGNDSRKENIPSNCTMQINTTKVQAFTQHEEIISSDILVNLNQSNDYISPFDQLLNEEMVTSDIHVNMNQCNDYILPFDRLPHELELNHATIESILDDLA